MAQNFMIYVYNYTYKEKKFINQFLYCMPYVNHKLYLSTCYMSSRCRNQLHLIMPKIYTFSSFSLLAIFAPDVIKYRLPFHDKSIQQVEVVDRVFDVTIPILDSLSFCFQRLRKPTGDNEHSLVKHVCDVIYANLMLANCSELNDNKRGGGWVIRQMCLQMSTFCQ